MVSIINLIFMFFIKLLPKSLVNIFARQYVAGENINDVLNVAKKINAKGFKATIDILGEHFTDKTQINQIVSEYKKLYREIDRKKLDANISIKPTHIGLDLSYKYLLENFVDILKTAQEYDNFLRIDMESSRVTDDTIHLYNDLIEKNINVGPVFQAYLYRTLEDLQNIKNKDILNFSLCKGIYKESSEIAISKYEEINKNYLKILEYFVMKSCTMRTC